MKIITQKRRKILDSLFQGSQKDILIMTREIPMIENDRDMLYKYLERMESAFREVNQ